MILSKSSWHFWLYKQFFIKAPTNFCPYFWKVMTSIVIFPIALVLALPWIVFSLVEGEGLEREKLGKMVGLGLASWIIMAVASCMMMVFFFYKNPPVAAVGIIGWAISIIIALTIAFENSREKKLFKNSFVGKFIEAKKSRYCPRIEWTEPEAPKYSSPENN